MFLVRVLLLRFAMGFCFAGLFMVIESWLNAHAASANRGRLLSIYRLIDLAAVTGAQFLLPQAIRSGVELSFGSGMMMSHTGIWAGGWLPDRWTAAIVRRQEPASRSRLIRGW